MSKKHRLGATCKLGAILRPESLHGEEASGRRNRHVLGADCKRITGRDALCKRPTSAARYMTARPRRAVNDDVPWTVNLLEQDEPNEPIQHQVSAFLQRNYSCAKMFCQQFSPWRIFVAVNTSSYDLTIPQDYLCYFRPARSLEITYLAPDTPCRRWYAKLSMFRTMRF